MGNNDIYLLAGDIGGTNTRLELYTAGTGGPLEYAGETYASGEAESLEEMVADLLERHAVTIAAACFGIAGRVTGGAARLTNLSWGVSEDNLRQRFQCKRIRLVNDLVATAMAVPWLAQEALFPLNRGSSESTGSIALVAPGTGLGQSLLVRSKDGLLALPSEGGHADFAPADETEARLWAYLYRRYGHVSIERVLSGPGLVNIYRWMAAGRGTDVAGSTVPAGEIMEAADPAQAITRHALEGSDDTCREALLQFCRILGAVAGNLALTSLATGGVYLGGGIPPQILPVLESSDFMKSFCAKGRFSDLLANIPVWVIRNDRAALMGAARRAFELLDA